MERINISNWSPASQSCHQHKMSLTSVTNIDLADSFGDTFGLSGWFVVDTIRQHRRIRHYLSAREQLII